MAETDLPKVVRTLVSRHLSSMDHVAVLLAMRASPEVLHTSASLAPIARIDTRVASAVLHDLSTAHLIAQSGDGYRYSPTPSLKEAVDRLADMYNTKPVTLVRAIYDRPPTAAKTFADAFRIRPAED